MERSSSVQARSVLLGARKTRRIALGCHRGQRRRSDALYLTAPATDTFEVHFAQSTDAGLTWVDDEIYNFSTVGFTLNTPAFPDSQRLLGDYLYLKAFGKTFYATFPATGNVNAGGINTTDKIVPFFYKVPAAVSITHRRSVRTHAGTPQSIVLDPSAMGDGLTGPTVEPRSGGIREIDIDFTSAVTLANANAITVMAGATPSSASVRHRVRVQR